MFKRLRLKDLFTGRRVCGVLDGDVHEVVILQNQRPIVMECSVFGKKPKRDVVRVTGGVSDGNGYRAIGECELRMPMISTIKTIVLRCTKIDIGGSVEYLSETDLSGLTPLFRTRKQAEGYKNYSKWIHPNHDVFTMGSADDLGVRLREAFNFDVDLSRGKRHYLEVITGDDYIEQHSTNAREEKNNGQFNI